MPAAGDLSGIVCRTDFSGIHQTSSAKMSEPGDVFVNPKNEAISISVFIPTNVQNNDTRISIDRGLLFQAGPDQRIQRPQGA